MEATIEKTFFDYYQNDIETKLENNEYILTHRKLSIDLNERYRLIVDYTKASGDKFIVRIIRYIDPIENSRKLNINDSLSEYYDKTKHNYPWMDKVIELINSLAVYESNIDFGDLERMILSDIRKEKIDKMMND